MAMTAAAAAQQRRELRQRIEQDRKKADRAKLRQLRERLKLARKHRRELARRVRESCAAARKEVRARARELAAQRAHVRSSCAQRKHVASQRGADSIARAARALEQEARQQSTLKRYAKPATLRATSRTRAAERIRESDDEVRNNLPDELVPVWNAMRSKFKGSPRRTRTEAFIEWAAENTGDVLRIQEAQFLADVEQMERDEYETRKRLLKPVKSYRPSKREVSRALREGYSASAEVPF